MKVVIVVKMRGQPNPYDEWLSRYEILKNQPTFLKIYNDRFRHLCWVLRLSLYGTLIEK